MARYREELSILRGQPFMERLAPIMSTAIFDGSNPSEVECVFRHVKLAHRHTTKLVLCQELRLIVLHEGSSQSRQRCHCLTNRSESSSLLVFVMSIDPIAPDHGCPRRQGRGRTTRQSPLRRVGKEIPSAIARRGAIAASASARSSTIGPADRFGKPVAK